jgi:hypothetical protein
MARRHSLQQPFQFGPEAEEDSRLGEVDLIDRHAQLVGDRGRSSLENVFVARTPFDGRQFHLHQKDTTLTAATPLAEGSRWGVWATEQIGNAVENLLAPASALG